MKPALFVLVAGCWSATHTDLQIVPVAVLDVEVASVSLAGDCPDPILATVDYVPVQAASQRGTPQPRSNASFACADGYDCSLRRACQQTRMQLSLRSHDASGATIQIKSVELYDGAGKRLGT
ncbi:MAG: hypothetical protein H0V17_29515, partial [Deltaproteobacteria bacterium]|nr:hypothetical protein [Deltaproteobacteria bacterium]